MPKLTVVQSDESAALVEFKAKSGRTFALKGLNGYELMQADDLAMSPEGNIRVMRIPSLRAMSSVRSIDGVPFGPLRSEVDVQKWSERLSSSEMEQLQEECSKRFGSGSGAELKNS